MFLITISNTIKFIAIQDITESEIHVLNKVFDNKFRIYNQAGFKIQRIHVDPELKPMLYIFEDIDTIMNYATSLEHVPEIDHAIRTIKERFTIYFHPKVDSLGHLVQEKF